MMKNEHQCQKDTDRMSRALCDSLKKVGYKGVNLDEILDEMVNDKFVISRASVHRRAIVQGYINDAEKEITENVTRRVLMIPIRPGDADLVPVLHCLFVSRDYECECVYKHQNVEYLTVKW